MKHTLSTIAMAVAALGAAPAASAQGYVGAGIGPSRIDINCTGTNTCDRNDVGFKLYGGWNLPGPFALEAAYFDWGKAESTSTPAGGGTSALKTDARGIGIGGAYFILFGWGQCMARLGIVGNRAETTTTLNGVGATNSYNYTAPYYGAGCAYPIAPRWWLTGEADFSRVKYTGSDKANVQLFTVGLRWTFP
jgi:OOP family OmpA-OmpF porin